MSSSKKSPARRFSVSATAFFLTSSSAVTVTTLWRMMRSYSLKSPLSLTTARNAPMRCEATTGYTCTPDPTPSMLRAKFWRSARRSPMSRHRSAMSSAPRWRRYAASQSTTPWKSNSTAEQPTRAESVDRMASRPFSSSTILVSFSCTARLRCRSEYCSLTILDATASVMARNGTWYGTSNSGKPYSSATLTSAGGTLSKVKPVPNPSPEMLWSMRRLICATCCSSSPAKL